MNVFPNHTRRFRSGPWLVAGLTVILVLSVAVFAVRNVQRARAHMMRNYLDHAEALFWALEAGTRIGMGMHGGPGYFQSLVEETAKQHGIVYLAVTDVAGEVIAHSDAVRIGTRLHPPGEVRDSAPSQELQGRFLTLAQGESVFEVYKKFSPLPGVHHSMWCPGMNGNAARGLAPGVPARKADDTGIFVGLDIRPLEEAVAEEWRHSAVIGSLVVLLGSGGFIALFWVERYRRSKRLLRDTRAFASEVVSCLPIGLLSTDPEGRVLMANAVADSLFGYEIDGMAGNELRSLGGLDWPGLLGDLAAEGALERETDLDFGTGGKRPIGLSASRVVNEDGQFLGHLFLLRDLTEVRRLQDQVRRNERLSALGNLAAGVAHEIRNPLSAIKGFATYLSGKVQGQDREAARAMVQETDRLNRVVSELLEFARPGEVTLREADLTEVADRALRLARGDVTARDIEVEFERDTTLPRIPLDPERMTQVLLNLILNAVQAMEPGGRLRLSCGVDEEGRKLALRVEDSGHGMTPDVIRDIFNPYFTTKSTGTGLGLAIVHRIVEAHDGEVKVESEPGRGTAFTILLPLAGRPA
jgi:two-component system sensor histidine kinase HydH